MSLHIKFNKSKNISFRVNPKSTSTTLTLILPGLTINLSVKRSKKKSKSIVDNSQRSYKPMDKVMLSQLQPMEYRSIITKISRLIKLNSLSNWLIPSLLLSLLPTFMIRLLGSQQPISTALTNTFITLGTVSINLHMTLTIFLIITGVMGIIIKTYVHSLGRLQYDTLSYSKDIPSLWDKLATSEKLWHIVGIIKHDENTTKKNGGIAISYERLPIKIKYKSPYYIHTNSKVMQIKLDSNTLVILPEHCFLIYKSKVGIIEYANLMINVKAIPYAETDDVPGDTEVLKTAWKYVNKDSSKDKRYKDNVQIPICNYGLISLKANTSFELMLLSSKVPII